MPSEFLERVAIRWDKAFADSGRVGNLTYIEVPAGVYTRCVWNKKIARRAAIGAYPAQQDIAVQIENADVSGQIVPDGTIHEGILPNIPPQAIDIKQTVLV